MKKLVMAVFLFAVILDLPIQSNSCFFVLPSAENGQNDRVANIADVVQWGLGLLHQQAIFENGAKGEIEKMSKVVPLCTACHFESTLYNPDIIGLKNSI